MKGFHVNIVGRMVKWIKICRIFFFQKIIEIIIGSQRERESSLTMYPTVPLSLSRKRACSSHEVRSLLKRSIECKLQPEHPFCCRTSVTGLPREAIQATLKY